MEKEVILKTFGTGQVTLPKAWRSQFGSSYFRAQVNKDSILITPIDIGNPLDAEVTGELVGTPGYITLADAKKIGYTKGIPADVFLKALRTSIEDDEKNAYGQTRKIIKKNRSSREKKH